MIAKFKNIDDVIKNCPQNTTIGNNLIKAFDIINRDSYKKILCSISGGSDSDILLDICYRCDINNKIDYVWFDTGLEYQATKDHLVYLENKYNIKIIKYKAKKSIPLSCKEYGVPFISKDISEKISRLQNHNFTWEDKTIEELSNEFPDVVSTLKWWCNENISRFNISNKKLLKEFLIDNPPEFKISNKCCYYAKKQIAHSVIKEGNYDLNITGIRKAEGGIRSVIYKNCFDDNGTICDNYRPLFWYKDNDKKDYENSYNIIHSKCYTKYGLKRTGCAGCPYGRDYKYELNILSQFEPTLYKAVMNIFKDSYDYMEKYNNYKKHYNN